MKKLIIHHRYFKMKVVIYKVDYISQRATEGLNRMPPLSCEPYLLCQYDSKQDSTPLSGGLGGGKNKSGSGPGCPKPE
jgi:hypothetical protein